MGNTALTGCRFFAAGKTSLIVLINIKNKPGVPINRRMKKMIQDRDLGIAKNVGIPYRY
jgi:hypothetical protein